MNTRDMQEKLAEVDRNQVDSLIAAVEATIQTCEKILDAAPVEHAPNELISQQQARMILRLSQSQLVGLKSNAERMKLPEISDVAKDQSGRVSGEKVNP